MKYLAMLPIYAKGNVTLWIYLRNIYGIKWYLKESSEIAYH